MTTIIGLVVGLLAIVIATVMDGNSFGALVGPSSLFLVVVGAIGVSIAGYQMSDVARVPKALPIAFAGKDEDPGAIVDLLMEFAEVARRDGVLALEAKLEDLDDAFLKAGLQQVVDGMDGDIVREVMEIELEALDLRHQTVISFFKTLGGYAPTMGMIGTVIGLINMLGNLSDPSQLGRGLSVALLTTLYGVIFANMVFLPMGAKLQRLHDLEMAVKEIALDGVLAVQAGSSPRMLVERLEAYLTPADRVGHQARAKNRAGGSAAEAA